MPSPLVQALAYQNSVNPVPSAVAPTDVVGSYRLASDVAEKNYQAKLAAQNAMFGGLAGLGGAGLMAFGPTAAKSIFGTGVTPAATAAAPAASSAAVPGAINAGSVLGANGLPIGTDLAAAAAPTVAADMGLGGAGAGAAGAGTVAADLGAAGATDAAAAAGTDLAASIPEWLTALLALA